MLNPDIYETMMNNDEAWYVFGNGYAVLLNDLPIYDA